MGYAFISYSSKDTDKASAVKKLLNKNNVKCWMAPDDITPGSTYAAEIYDAINNCSCFILILTENAQKSNSVIKEIELAFRFDKAVLPLKFGKFDLNSALSYYLNSIHIVSLTTVDENLPVIKKVINSVIMYTDSSLSFDSASEYFKNYKKSIDIKQTPEKSTKPTGSASDFLDLDTLLGYYKKTPESNSSSDKKQNASKSTKSSKSSKDEDDFFNLLEQVLGKNPE